MKKLISLILLTSLLGCLILTGCGNADTPKTDSFVGTWHGTYTFNEKEFTVDLHLNEDNSYTKDYTINGVFAETETGVYTIENGDLLLHAVNEQAYTRYKFVDNALVNNDHPLYKVD